MALLELLGLALTYDNVSSSKKQIIDKLNKGSQRTILNDQSILFLVDMPRKAFDKAYNSRDETFEEVDFSYVTTLKDKTLIQLNLEDRENCFIYLCVVYLETFGDKVTPLNFISPGGE